MLASPLPDVQPAIDTLREGVKAIYGARLKGLILFGSRARGDARPDSDIDIAVILDQVVDRGRERALLSDLRAQIHLHSELFISFLFLTPEQLRDGERLLYRNIRSEGVQL